MPPHLAAVAAVAAKLAVIIWVYATARHRNRRLQDDLDAAEKRLSTDINVLRGIASLAEFTAAGQTTGSASAAPPSASPRGSGPAR